MPIYEEKKTTNGQKRYYIRTYVIDNNGNKKQVTKHNLNWIGKNGKLLARQEELRLQNKICSNPEFLKFNYLSELYLKDIENNIKESTYVSYKENIKNQLMPALKNKEVTYENILNWHIEMENKNLSVAYLNKVNTILRNILNVGIKYHILDRNFINDIGNFKENKNKIDINCEKIRYITLEDFNKFIIYVDNLMWFTIFNILYFTGMRKGELIALTWKDIDWENSQIIINKTYTDRTRDGQYKITTTKNYTNRKIDIDISTMRILKQWYDNEHDEDYNEDNFIFGKTHPISTTTLTRKKNEYFESAKFSKPFITIHEFRHSHVSLLINEYLKNGYTDTTKFFIMMSNRMGHTIQVMQDTYMHLFPDTQKPIVNLLNNITI